MNKDLKEKIIKLRLEGKSYNEIKNNLNCSKGTISFHCKNLGLTVIDGLNYCNKTNQSLVKKIKHYYKNHTCKETALKFNVSCGTVINYSDSKKKPTLTLEEKRIKRYKLLTNRRYKNKIKALEYKGNKCSICGYNKSIWSLHFHHLNESEKQFSISKYAGMSWEKLKKELDKCILVCANCHGEIHEEAHKSKIS